MNPATYMITLVLLNLHSIIMRHDKSDLEYQELSKQFEKNICHLNLPDCEGTLIRKDWILTAAHCAVEIQEKLKKGQSHYVIITNEYYKVERVVIHEDWINDEAYDIALILIEEPARSSEPVDVYTRSDELNKIVYVVGKGDYGDGMDGIKENDGKLRAATNRVEEATDFWLKWTFDNPEKSPDDATQYEGISGPGDSGGPAFIVENGRTYIVGISSGQSTRNTDGKEGVYGVREYYTRVSKYVDWIKKNMQSNK